MLKFSKPLQKGVLIKRYKRFFADVRMGDEIVVAHCANTGTMRTCADPGMNVWLSPAESAERKLRWTWEYTEIADGGLIGVNTSRPNKVVELAVKAALESGKKSELATLFAGYQSVRGEVKYGKSSRIDLLLSGHSSGRDCYVEVKNTTLFDSASNSVQFPDAVTERGLKHLEELAAMVKSGQRAVMFYLVNRPDGREFRPAIAVDPAYCEGIRKAAKAGVEFIAWRADNRVDGSTLGSSLPVVLS